MFQVLISDGGGRSSVSCFIPFFCVESVSHFTLPPNITEGRSEDNDSNSTFDLGVPDDLVVSVLLRNWLFALEGTEEARDWSSPRSGDPIGRDDKCWHKPSGICTCQPKVVADLTWEVQRRCWTKEHFQWSDLRYIHGCYTSVFRFVTLLCILIGRYLVVPSGWN